MIIPTIRYFTQNMVANLIYYGQLSYEKEFIIHKIHLFPAPITESFANFEAIVINHLNKIFT